jgi:Fur family ferric uptake transcriptional regulator
VAVSTWAEATLGELREQGFRAGGARRAVIELLDGQTCCVSAKEIAERLRESGRSVGLASVYRVLDLLSAKGFLHRIEVGAGTALYEPIREEPDHHHHLVCDDCGRIETVSDERLEEALAQLEQRAPYAVARHEVLLRGACTDCADV